MSVNLKKENNQRNKVSLRKEERLTEREPIPDSASMAAESTQRHFSKLWIGAAAAAVLLFLIVMALTRKSSVMTENDSLTADVNDSAQLDDNAAVEDILEDAPLMDAGSAEDVESESNLQETDTEEIIADEPIEKEEEDRIDDTAIHNYEVISADVSWSEAFADCAARGGYLCRINSSEENEVVKKLLNDQGIRGVVYLGGMRGEGEAEYHWVDENKEFFADIINEGEYKQFWYEGEPSYVDHVNGEEKEERYMSILYRGSKQEWVWNDVSDDVLSLSPAYYSGRLSYICEYE